MAQESERTGTQERENNGPLSTHDPIIVDLGRRSKRKINRLRKGCGDLMDEVDDCLQELISVGRVDASAHQVIIVVAEKSKRLSPVFAPPGIPFPMAEEDEDDADEDDEDD
jgi:hypothetical protein